jgi:transketolase
MDGFLNTTATLKNDIIDLAEKVGYVYIATADQDGLPHLTIAGKFVLRDADHGTIIACGLMVPAALEAASILNESGLEMRVLDMHTVKPLDETAIELAATETGAIVTAEEHVLQGGLGAGVSQVVASRHPVPMAFVGLDQYTESGKPEELLTKYGLMPNGIVKAVHKVLARKP